MHAPIQLEPFISDNIKERVTPFFREQIVYTP